MNMQPIPWMTMSGSQRDMLVAQVVMNWVPRANDPTAPRYSSDSGATIQVVERLAATGRITAMTIDAAFLPHVWEVSMTVPVAVGLTMHAAMVAPSLAEAICLVALDVCDVRVDDRYADFGDFTPSEIKGVQSLLAWLPTASMGNALVSPDKDISRLLAAFRRLGNVRDIPWGQLPYLLWDNMQQTDDEHNSAP